MNAKVPQGCGVGMTLPSKELFDSLAAHILDLVD